jgi:threonine/homoserine/homoserine lactone efflux protein
MDQRAILDHQFVAAAYTITWLVQLGYLAWLGFKWRAQKRDAAKLRRTPR